MKLKHPSEWPEPQRTLGAWIVGLGAVLLITSLGSCGGGLPPISWPPGPPSPWPPSPSPRPTSTAGPIPTPTPAPSPTPRPTPSPGPSNPPSPAPTPTPPSSGCSLPQGTGGDSGCVITQGQRGPYDGEVSAAISSLAESVVSPARPGGQILDFQAYERGLVEALRARGFCAYWDGAELALKRETNEFSAQYDVVQSSGRALVLYAARCSPALAVIPSGGGGQGPGPGPGPTPSPSAPPSPCTPVTRTEPVCPDKCWVCEDRLRWDVDRGNLAVLPGPNPKGVMERVGGTARQKCVGGSPLCFNDPGNDPSKREYIDKNCNKVDRQGNILRRAVDQYGQGCEGNLLCPPDRVVVVQDCGPSGPPPPTPPPGGQCPNVSRVGTYLHSVICNGVVSNNPDGSPRPAAGCRHSFGVTAYFGCPAQGSCGNFYRCSECSYEWSKNGCCGGLGQDALGKVNQCDDPRGPEFFLDGESWGRTWRLNVTLGTGRYTVDACARDWVDRLGRRHGDGGCSVSPVRVVVP